VVRTLRTALSSGKLAHAYLFSGPRGSGKTSAAKILARCVNCVNGPTPDPDNTCEHCLAILAGTALDVLEIDAASNRGIDDIRSLREAVRFAPAQMRMKVYILDEAHQLTREGADAFLKTLEEPPPHALFILATTAPEKLQPTILSRCQRYAFRRISVGKMIERMRVVADAEKIPIDDDALAAIAYRADGGLRDALTMLEQAASFRGDGSAAPIDADTIEAAFGASGRSYARALVAAILRPDAAACLRIIDEASEAGTDMEVLLAGVLAEYRNLLVGRLNADLLGRDLSAADAQATIAAASSTPQPKVVRGLRVLADAYAAARWTSARLELETAVLRLVLQDEDASLEALASRVALLEQTGRPAGAPAASEEPAAQRSGEPAPEAPAPKRPSSQPALEQVRGAWPSVRVRAEGERPPLRAPLSRAMVSAVKDGVVVLAHSDPNQAAILRENAAVVERAIADVLGAPLRLQVVHERGGQPRSAHRGAPSAQDGGPKVGEAEGSGLDLLDYATEKIGRRGSL
jgi:DNA polymerase III subunit gamma/tau